jgi:predicted enzyme related to lactoylglutathione lyase
MPRIVHFEVHAENPERAIRFYSEALGWQFHKWEGGPEYWLIQSGPKEQPGIDGGLLRRHGPAPADMQPVNAYTCVVDVPVLADCLTKVTAAGGTIALPTMAVPHVGWVAYAKDTEGNIFGMMQRDPNAR